MMRVVEALRNKEGVKELGSEGVKPNVLLQRGKRSCKLVSS